MTDIMSRPRRIDIGEVMNRTFGAIGPNFVTFFLLSVILAAIPTMLITIGMYSLLPGWLTGMDTTAGIFAFAGVSMILGLLAMIPGFVLIGAVTHGAIMHFNGRRATFGECLASGMSYALALIGLGLATFFGLLLWYFLLLIPAILAAVRWAVAAPALVVERRSVWDAFKRSNELTRDNRWRIFVLALIYFAISAAIAGAVGFVSLMLLGAPQFDADANPMLAALPDYSTGAAWFQSIFETFYAALNSMILAVGQTALYFELRRVKEGATTDELAKVFE